MAFNLEAIVGFKTDKASLKRVIGDVTKEVNIAVQKPDVGAAPGIGDIGGALGDIGGSIGALGAMGPGIAAIGTGIGLAVIALNQGLEILGKISDTLSEASPALKGTFELMGAAFKLFFKPFGDFLSSLLRPMAIFMIKMALQFNKFLQALVPEKPPTEAIFGEGVTPAVFEEAKKEFAEDLREKTKDTVTDITGSETLGEIIGGFVGGIVEFLTGLGQFLVEKILLPLGTLIVEVVLMPLFKIGASIGKVIKEMGEGILQFLRENPLTDLVIGTIGDTIAVFTQLLEDVLAFDFDFSRTLELVEIAMNNLMARLDKALEELGLKAILKQIETTVTNFVGGIVNWFNGLNLDTIFEPIATSITEVSTTIKNFFDRFREFFEGITFDTKIVSIPLPFDLGAFSFGVPFPKFPTFQTGGVMARSGLAMLEAGERVLRPGEARGGPSTYSPIITIYANIASDVDIDLLARRLGEKSHEEFRRFTSIGAGHLR